MQNKNKENEKIINFNKNATPILTRKSGVVAMFKLCPCGNAQENEIRDADILNSSRKDIERCLITLSHAISTLGGTIVTFVFNKLIAVWYMQSESADGQICDLIKALMWLLKENNRQISVANNCEAHTCLKACAGFGSILEVNLKLTDEEGEKFLAGELMMNVSRGAFVARSSEFLIPKNTWKKIGSCLGKVVSSTEARDNYVSLSLKSSERSGMQYSMASLIPDKGLLISKYRNTHRVANDEVEDCSILLLRVGGIVRYEGEGWEREVERAFKTTYATIRIWDGYLRQSWIDRNGAMMLSVFPVMHNKAATAALAAASSALTIFGKLHEECKTFSIYVGSGALLRKNVYQAKKTFIGSIGSLTALAEVISTHAEADSRILCDASTRIMCGTRFTFRSLNIKEISHAQQIYEMKGSLVNSEDDPSDKIITSIRDNNNICEIGFENFEKNRNCFLIVEGGTRVKRQEMIRCLRQKALSDGYAIVESTAKEPDLYGTFAAYRTILLQLLKLSQLRFKQFKSLGKLSLGDSSLLSHGQPAIVAASCASFSSEVFEPLLPVANTFAELRNIEGSGQFETFGKFLSEIPMKSDDLEAAIVQCFNLCNLDIVNAHLLSDILPINLYQSSSAQSMNLSVRYKLLKQLVFTIVKNLSQILPIILILDEAQWQDPASWALSEEIAQHCSNVFLVLVVSSDTKHEVLQRLRLSSRCFLLHLGGNNIEDTRQLIINSYWPLIVRVPRGIVELIHCRTGGETEAVRQLVISLKKDKCLENIGGQLRLINNMDLLQHVEFQIQQNGHQFIKEEFEQLTTTEKFVAQIACRLQEKITLLDLKSILNEVKGDNQTEEALQSLQQHGFTCFDLDKQGNPEVVYWRIRSTHHIDGINSSITLQQDFHICRLIANFYEKKYLAHKDDSRYLLKTTEYYSNSNDVAKKLYYLEKTGDFYMYSCSFDKSISCFEKLFNTYGAMCADRQTTAQTMTKHVDKSTRARWFGRLGEGYLAKRNTSKAISNYTASLRLFGFHWPPHQSALITKLQSSLAALRLSSNPRGICSMVISSNSEFFLIIALLHALRVVFYGLRQEENILLCTLIIYAIYLRKESQTYLSKTELLLELANDEARLAYLLWIMPSADLKQRLAESCERRMAEVTKLIERKTMALESAINSARISFCNYKEPREALRTIIDEKYIDNTYENAKIRLADAHAMQSFLSGNWETASTLLQNKISRVGTLMDQEEQTYYFLDISKAILIMDFYTCQFEKAGERACGIFNLGEQVNDTDMQIFAVFELAMIFLYSGNLESSKTWAIKLKDIYASHEGLYQADLLRFSGLLAIFYALVLGDVESSFDYLQKCKNHLDFSCRTAIGIVYGCTHTAVAYFKLLLHTSFSPKRMQDARRFVMAGLSAVKRLRYFWLTRFTTEFLLGLQSFLGNDISMTVYHLREALRFATRNHLKMPISVLLAILQQIMKLEDKNIAQLLSYFDVSIEGESSSEWKKCFQGSKALFGPLPTRHNIILGSMDSLTSALTTISGMLCRNEETRDSDSSKTSSTLRRNSISFEE